MPSTRTKSLQLGLLSLVVTASAALVLAGPQEKPAQKARPKPEDTEFWQPEPPVVTPGDAAASTAPSDAVVLFDGKNLDEWVIAGSQKPATWNVKDGIIEVNKKSGNIETKRKFKDYQLHVEYRIPADIEGTSQGRGNSGVFLASTGGGDAGYELQILDNYNNKTYVNGMAGSLYKQAIPLANACRKPGEWQSYDVVWTAPRFKEDGEVETPAFATVFLNGVLVENHFQLRGETAYIGKGKYKKYDTAPVKLQAHGDKSSPMAFRNIWIRDVKPADVVPEAK